mmetsp:Transcript_42175/g.126153  ORF Transcript_42175/g.126153 Transcript_42175/m.126153 type:complete len:240 (-) Transcript_42175:425-1144(-)
MAGESNGSALFFCSAAFLDALAPLAAGSALTSAESDSFSTAACSAVIEDIVCAWNICPMNPASRKGSSGCSFTVGPGRVCTSCDSSCCRLLSCIIEAMALVSKVPIHSGGSGPRAAAPSVASASLSASSSGSSPVAWRSTFAAGLVFFAGSWWPSSSCGLLMSSAICRRTSKAPPPRFSRFDIERSVLRSTSRTCTGFRRASAACAMNSSSCSIWLRSGQPSSNFCKRGSILTRLRMKS